MVELLEQERFKIMDDFNEVMANEEAERSAKDNAILVQVKNMVSDSDYNFINEDMEECNFVYDLLIVDHAVGDIQDDDDGVEHGYKFVNQTTNGGYTGDEYAGDVFIPISPTQFLKFSYSM